MVSIKRMEMELAELKHEIELMEKKRSEMEITMADKDPVCSEKMVYDIEAIRQQMFSEIEAIRQKNLRNHVANLEETISTLDVNQGVVGDVQNKTLRGDKNNWYTVGTSSKDFVRVSYLGMKNTILHILSANGHVDLVSTICDKDNSLLKVCNVRNETPFHHAARFGRMNIILKLIDCAKSAFGEDGMKELLRQKNCLGETALHEAATHGHGAVVATLMDSDLELAGLVNDDLVSPLYLATARGSLDIVKDMVEKMLNHEITSEFYSGPREQTALHAAVLQGQELTQELLQLYSEPLGKKADETGRTPIHYVASTGNHKIAKLLLDTDPSLAYIQDSDGSFPVHTAVRMGHVNLIVLLLQRCLDSGELLDGNGRNFLHIAIEAGKSDVIFKLLKDSKNKLPIPYWKEIYNNMANTMDNKGNTPLHLAAERGGMMSLLKNNKLDLALQNKESLTAFDLSVIRHCKFARNTKKKDILGEYYVQERGYRFSTGWFQYYIKDPMSKSEQIGCTIKDHNSTTDARDAKRSSELIRCTIKDHNSTTDARAAKKSSELVLTKAQIVGLGSVLVATVTFAAAFTLPGDTNQVTDTSIPYKRFYSKGCIIANFLAFILSFLSTMMLIFISSDEDSDRIDEYVAMSMHILNIAARCMVLAMAFGLFVVLHPISKNTATIVLVISCCLAYVDLPFGVHQQLQWFMSEMFLLRHIPDGASAVKQKFTRTVKEQLYILCLTCVLPIAPLILIHVLAHF
ncbi:uncharacterized protein LOC144550644 [Carex rostrata]